MTSTNFNIGMNETSRNSSRVLKPPGGGHSDIFGIYEPQEPQTPKAKNYPRSTISEVFGASEPVAVAVAVTNSINQKEKKTEEEQIDNHVSNGNGNENEAPKPPITTPQRTRVPPGGFSSGLW